MTTLFASGIAGYGQGVMLALTLCRDIAEPPETPETDRATLQGQRQIARWSVMLQPPRAEELKAVQHALSTYRQNHVRPAAAKEDCKGKHVLGAAHIWRPSSAPSAGSP